MNYYPYFNTIPYAAPRNSLFKGLFKGINFSSILNGTQKTLNVVNQAIPLIKQAKPMVDNAKTMFRVMNEFKKTEEPIINKKETTNEEKKSTVTLHNSGPTFFQ